MGCHAVFQPATPQPLIALHRRSRLTPNNLSLSQNPNPHHRPLLPPACPRKYRLAVRASAAAAPAPAPTPEAMPGAVEPGQWDALERCFASSPDFDRPSCSSSSSSLLASGVMAPVMKGQYGAFGAVTLEKSKLDLSQKTTQSSPEFADMR
ncbi:putative protein RETICULATA-RELATED 1, chloroplastic [Cocos nucifera]|nr:putative protein RETICULATA-RELATED 1, chloroplastic [Cocos nucifera]